MIWLTSPGYVIVGIIIGVCLQVVIQHHSRRLP